MAKQKKTSSEKKIIINDILDFRFKWISAQLREMDNRLSNKYKLNNRIFKIF